MLRPLDPRRDLPALAELVEIAFPNELDRAGLDMRRELRSIGRWLPLFVAVGRVAPTLRHSFDGFAWEEDGRLVGLVMVQPEGSDLTRWLIGTVATHPAYRHRGIARRLTETALAHAAQHGAEVCVLDVAAENEPAYALYRSLGFTHYDSSKTLRLDGPPPANGAAVPPGYVVRKMDPGEWRARYALAQAALPADVQAFAPVNAAAYRFGPGNRLLTAVLLRLQKLHAFWIAADSGARLAGWARLVASTTPRRPHRFSITVCPADEAVIAGPLVAAGLAPLRDHPAAATNVVVPAGQPHLVQALRAVGFVETEHSHRLGLHLKRGRPGPGGMP